MAEINLYGTKVEMTVSLILPEDQARALKWVVDYGADNLTKFAQDSTEGARHKQALKALVSDLREGLGQTLARADRARQAFKPENLK